LIAEKERSMIAIVLGVILIFVGLILCLTLIGILLGIPVIGLGILLLLSGNGIYRCTRCEAKYPRKSAWWQK
jgi:hypothetical protein